MRRILLYRIKVALFITIGSSLFFTTILRVVGRSETKNATADSTIEINRKTITAASKSPTKRVLFWRQQTLESLYLKNIGEETQDKVCDYQCEFTTNRTLFDSSGAVLFHGLFYRDMHPDTITSVNNVTLTRPDQQYWIFYFLESPKRFPAGPSTDIYNLTMTYRLDSDIYTPYSRLLEISSEEPKTMTSNQDILKTKTKLVAWIVSNCLATSRNKIVNQLREYITVDEYGKCGNYTCPPKDSIRGSCYRKIGGSYKFYLAFENSVCTDYVTEKFFNALDAGMVPVVYGGADYTLHAPEGSFINVNSFTSIKDLAEYLLMLDKNPSEYLKYFEWRKRFEVDNVSAFPRAWCNLCERLTKGSLPKKKVIRDLKSWWNFYKNVSACK